MDRPDTIVKIQTLGRFGISVDGITVAADWPSETVKVLFCSLLSPLDLNFPWDRICRSMWGVPATPDLRQRLEEICIRPLNGFLIRELGFNPLVVGTEGIRIVHQGIHLDVLEFYSTVLGGLRLLSHSNHAAAADEFSRANLLYTGSYLPGIPGKIIENTRYDLEALYRTTVMDSMPHIRNAGCSVGNRNGRYLAV